MVIKMSKFDLLYLNEKAEELRSRLALAHSSVETLDQIFSSIYNKFIMKNRVPPFIYPYHQIKNLKDQLENSIYLVNNRIILNETMTSNKEVLRASFIAFANHMRNLEQQCEKILSASQVLLSVLEQRILDLEIFDDLRYSENLQHEFIGLTKVFQSIDALTYQLLKNTLGEDWMRDKKFAPVTILGEKDYSINTETYVVNVPYHDCFRSRYWATLAHEAAHVFFYYYWKEAKDEEFAKNFNRNIYRLGEVLDSIWLNENEFETTYEVKLQVIELICDIVACYVCGPPPFLSLCTYDRFTLSYVDIDKNTGISVTQKEHPPLFFRLYVMRKTLQHTEILSVDKDLREFISSVVSIAEFDTDYTLRRYDEDFLPHLFEDYTKFADQISEDILCFLDKLRSEGKIKYFGKNEFVKLVKSVKNMELERLTPIEAMNIIWLKRRARTFENPNPNLCFRQFYKARKNETKIFEMTVFLCYNYFEHTVCAETKEDIDKAVNEGKNKEVTLCSTE